MKSGSEERFIPGISSQRIFDDHKARYDFASKYIQQKDVLDIACGSGFGSHLMATSGARSVFGADIDFETIACAQKKYQAKNLSFYQRDISKLTFSDVFDVIVSFETIEHIHSYEDTMLRLYSALRKGGMLIISTPNREITTPQNHSLNQKPINPFHAQEFILPELLHLLKKTGFQKKSICAYGQRQQLFFSNRLLRRVYKILFKPDHSTSCAVTPILLHPRYLVLTAYKN